MSCKQKRRMSTNSNTRPMSFRPSKESVTRNLPFSTAFRPASGSVFLEKAVPNENGNCIRLSQVALDKIHKITEKQNRISSRIGSRRMTASQPFSNTIAQPLSSSKILNISNKKTVISKKESQAGEEHRENLIMKLLLSKSLTTIKLLMDQILYLKMEKIECHEHEADFEKINTFFDNVLARLKDNTSPPAIYKISEEKTTVKPTPNTSIETLDYFKQAEKKINKTNKICDTSNKAYVCPEIFVECVHRESEPKSSTRTNPKCVSNYNSCTSFFNKKLLYPSFSKKECV